jgi:hypothetical protein
MSDPLRYPLGEPECHAESSAYGTARGAVRNMSAEVIIGKVASEAVRCYPETG